MNIYENIKKIKKEFILNYLILQRIQRNVSIFLKIW